jgi:hypothetical protein
MYLTCKVVFILTFNDLVNAVREIYMYYFSREKVGIIFTELVSHFSPLKGTVQRKGRGAKLYKQ